MFIDISKWNGIFDWNKAVLQGVDGAYIKATGCGGGNYEDYRFKENSTSCPLKYKGNYHYFDYRGYSGADQCKYFLDKTGNSGNLRGVVDIEDNSYNGWAKISVSYGLAMKELRAFCDTYKAETGHDVVIYTNTGLSAEQQWTVTGYKYIFRNFVENPFWCARYDNVPDPLVLNSKRRSAWSECALWQYTRGGDGLAFGNSPGNIAIDLDRVMNLQALLKPGVTFEDDPSQPVTNPSEVTDTEKLNRLWQAHPDLH